MASVLNYSWIMVNRDELSDRCYGCSALYLKRRFLLFNDERASIFLNLLEGNASVIVEALNFIFLVLSTSSIILFSLSLASFSSAMRYIKNSRRSSSSMPKGISLSCRAVIPCPDIVLSGASPALYN